VPAGNSRTYRKWLVADVNHAKNPAGIDVREVGFRDCGRKISGRIACVHVCFTRWKNGEDQ